MKHALVVGGTGMLAGVTRYLASLSDRVTLVARRPERVSGERIAPLAVDYNDLMALRAGLQAAGSAGGPFDLAVVWLSDADPGVLEAILAAGAPRRLLVVRGSRAADPERDRGVLGERLSGHRYLPLLAEPSCEYGEVILGWVAEEGPSRWLTHEEIASGVIGAIEVGRPETVVGVVRPWSARP